MAAAARPGPKKKPLMRLLDALSDKAQSISVFLLAGGLLGLLALPLLERAIGFDEKGLLAGGAFPTLRCIVGSACRHPCFLLGAEVASTTAHMD